MKDLRSLRLYLFTLPAGVMLLLGSVAFAQQNLQIKGTETSIYLGQRVSNLYQKDAGTSSLQVVGGGVPQVISPGQIAQWEGNKAQSNRQVVFPVSVQAIVIYVNRSNPVWELTLAEVRKIFLGEITNWKQLGGADNTILLYAGESSTGTLAYFQDSILRGEEPYPSRSSQ
jgi:phosphate transport system substrate-binding protein